MVTVHFIPIRSWVRAISFRLAVAPTNPFIVFFYTQRMTIIKTFRVSKTHSAGIRTLNSGIRIVNKNSPQANVGVVQCSVAEPLSQW